MTSTQPLQTLHRRPGFLLKRCHQVSMAIFLEECSEFNVTQSQYGCLRVLQKYAGLDQIAVGRLVGLDRSTAGLVIKALSKRGLVERVINRSDKRRMQLALSPDGERLLRDMASAAARAQDRVLGGLPPKSRVKFLVMLEQFLAGHDAVINVDDVLSASYPATESRNRTSRRSARRVHRVNTTIGEQ